MALCVSQRQHCFPVLAQLVINVVPFMRDCLTTLAHGLPSASPQQGEMLVSLALPLQSSKQEYLPKRDCQ